MELTSRLTIVFGFARCTSWSIVSASRSRVASISRSSEVISLVTPAGYQRVPHGYRAQVTRLSPGDTAPDFTLTSDTGEQVSLADLRGHKVIVYFYPNAMTPGCTTQACDFSDSLSSLKAAGYEVVGIAPNDTAKLAKFRARDGLTITLASDED